MTFMELAGKLDVTAARSVALATGEAGTGYLCHPFLVHAAQPHHGMTPRFMAQPPLFLREPFPIHHKEGNPSPVERAIRQGMQREGRG